tara:strand:+ start:892 stop:1731 length:840 start_codon:yes stop_codon:yes gene_type:complete
MSDRETKISEYRNEALKYHRLSKQYQDKDKQHLAKENKKKAIEFLKHAKRLETMDEERSQIQRNLERAEQDPEIRDELLRGISEAVRNNETRRRERQKERETRRSSTVSRRSGTASQSRTPVVVVEESIQPSGLEGLAEISTPNPSRTLRDGSQLHDLTAMMRHDIETSERIARDTQRDLEERNAELRRLAALTGISVDEYLDQCSDRPVAPPVGPAPSQPSKLKLWLKNFWQAINCSGPQGGKKTRKYRKYKNKSKKHKKFKKSRKHKNKRNKKNKKN